MENRPLVKFIQNCIWDSSGVFSISSLVRISMMSFPAFTLLFVQKYSSVYIIKRKLHVGLKIWILFSCGKKQYFTFHHLKIKFISSRRRVISSIYIILIMIWMTLQNRNINERKSQVFQKVFNVSFGRTAISYIVSYRPIPSCLVRETPSKTNTSVIFYYSSSEGIHIYWTATRNPQIPTWNWSIIIWFQLIILQFKDN